MIVCGVACLKQSRLMAHLNLLELKAQIRLGLLQRCHLRR
jgi:hypothetical protein